MASRAEDTFVLNIDDDVVPAEINDKDVEVDLRIEMPDRVDLSPCTRSSYAIGAPSIIVTRENFADLPTISKCLPEVKPVTDEPSRVLSAAKMHVLSYHLPGTIRLTKW